MVKHNIQRRPALDSFDIYLKGDFQMVNKNIYLIIFITICIMQYVYADTNVTVVSMKYFTPSADKSSTTEKTIDWLDDDTMNVYENTILQVQMRYKNTYTSNIVITTTSNLELEDDTLDASKEVTLEPEMTKTVLLEYTIPKGTGEYDYRLKYKFIINGTTYNYSKSMTVKIKKVEVTQQDQLTNLTAQLIAAEKERSALVEKIYNISNNAQQLTECKTALELSKKEADDCEKQIIVNADLKTKYDTECIKTSTLNTQLATCNAQLATPNCEDKVNTAKSTQQSEDTRFGLIIIAIAGGAYFMMRKKKQVGGAGEGKPVQGATWK